MVRFFPNFGRVWKGPSLNDLDDQPRVRSISTRGDQSQPILPDPTLTMTSWDLKMLKSSWTVLRKHNIGTVMFTAVFDKYPESMRLFGLKNAPLRMAVGDYRVRRQALIVEDTIDMVIIDMEKGGDGLRKPLFQLGEQHSHLAKRGFSKDYWIVFGQSLLDVVSQHPIAGMNRLKRWKVQRLWRRLLYFMLSCLSAGFLSCQERDTSNHSKDRKHNSPSGSVLALLEVLPEDMENQGRRPSKVGSQLLEMMALTVPVRL